MKIKWLGHASFIITADDGVRIITDPFGDYPGLSYKPIDEAADIMVVTHKHGDHFGASIRGNPKQVSKPGLERIGAIEFKGIGTYHDTVKGKDRGENTVFCFAVDGVRICHLGDLGHKLTDSDVSELGRVDVLMIPVGGYFTINAATAGEICEKVKPRVVLPMHYSNEKCAFPIAGVDEFLEGKPRVKKLDATEVEFRKGQLPEETEIIVLKPAL